MSEEIAIPIVALSIPVFVVPTVLFFKHASRKRELEHRERMAAIDRGIHPPQAPSLFWPSMAALGIGMVVPVAAILFALIATSRGSLDDDIWAPAVGLGMVAIVGGSVLGVKMLGLNQRTSSVQQDSVKPHYDPDEYDTVGTRA